MTSLPNAPVLDPFDVPAADLRSRTSAKWLVHDPDVIPLWVAEMDVAPCPAVVEAVGAAMRSGDTGYSHGDRYARAYRDFAEDRWGWSFESSSAPVFADVMTAIVEVLGVLTSPGDTVVVNSPVYPPFYTFPRREGRHVVEAPLGPEGRLDFAALESAFAAATSGTSAGVTGGRVVYLICNPHNPTGTVHSVAELDRALRIARRYGVRVVADEAHGPLDAPGARYVPLLSVPGSADAVAICSASKGWNLAGLRAALAVAGPDAAEDIRRIPEEAAHGVSHIAVIAHEAAVRDGRDWLDAVVAGIESNKDLVLSLLADQIPAISCRRPAGTYVAWLDCRDLPRPVAEEPAAWFHEHARVALNDGSAYGTGGAGFVRLNLATRPDLLTEAVQRMADALAHVD